MEAYGWAGAAFGRTHRSAPTGLVKSLRSARVFSTGWGLRNAKLRLSRKMIFASGLALCLRVQARSQNPKDRQDRRHEFLVKGFELTPLELLAETCLMYDVPKQASRTLFDTYDTFLKILSNKERRAELDNLSAEAARVKNSPFDPINDLARAFQDGLEQLFFDHKPFQPLTRKYGVF